MDIKEIAWIAIPLTIPCCMLAYFIFHAITDALFAPKEKYQKLSSDLESKHNSLEIELNEKYSQAKLEYKKLEQQLREHYEDLERRLKKEYNVKYAEELKTLNRDRDLLNLILASKKQSNPAMAQVFADYEWYIANRASLRLYQKKRPAKKAADDIKTFGKRNRELKQQNKELEYQISFWENLFPWLSEFKEVSVEEISTTNIPMGTQTEYESLKKWLSPNEYNNLSDIEKYQLALDRYRQRKNKSKWEIGIEYERYIGYLYEKANYKVEYNGALAGLQDMGRDLIASKDNEKLVIQCKYWNANKTIHEKHIFQLFGSVTLLKLQDRQSNISGVFVTSAKLSDIASQVADELHIQVRENIPMSYEYPCIKCNINTTTKEKIYHLPFDQQYDNCVIKKELGEFFAMTVKEAEEKGFRRAFRWKGSNQ